MSFDVGQNPTGEGREDCVLFGAPIYGLRENRKDGVYMTALDPTHNDQETSKQVSYRVAGLGRRPTLEFLFSKGVPCQPRSPDEYAVSMAARFGSMAGIVESGVLSIEQNSTYKGNDVITSQTGFI